MSPPTKLGKILVAEETLYRAQSLKGQLFGWFLCLTHLCELMTYRLPGITPVGLEDLMDSGSQLFS